MLRSHRKHLMGMHLSSKCDPTTEERDSYNWRISLGWVVHVYELHQMLTEKVSCCLDSREGDVTFLATAQAVVNGDSLYREEIFPCYYHHLLFAKIGSITYLFDFIFQWFLGCMTVHIYLFALILVDSIKWELFFCLDF